MYNIIYIYTHTTLHLHNTLLDLVRHPCSTLFDHRLFDPLFDLIRHPCLTACSTACSTLVRPCSTLVRPLFDRLFDVLVQSYPGPAKSEHPAAEVARYFV